MQILGAPPSSDVCIQLTKKPSAYMEDVYGCVGLNPSALFSFTKTFVTVTDRNNLLAASILPLSHESALMTLHFAVYLSSLLAALNSREALWERCFGATLMELSSTILRTTTPVRAQVIFVGAESQAD
ncbi:hypothetical protein DXG01_008874 [Tephrocybe rancida]|nr:hypothetical protein DXG01_008874 [Tephrocybe rancida]